jgi:3-oxoacyl-[acyl-carrier protein] reductase
MSSRPSVIVTGAGGGIGRAVCLELAAEGFSVVAADNDAEAVHSTGRQIHDSDGESVVAVADVTAAEQVLRVRDMALQTFQRIDALVYASGVLHRAPSHELSLKEWEYVMGVNLTGAFLCAQAVHGPMRQRHGGRIINISSIAAHSSSVLGGVHYTSSKAGLLGLTRHLAREWAPDGIAVNCVSPGFIDTPMTERNVSSSERLGILQRIPVGRIGQPEDVAKVVAFLASADTAYVTGADIAVHGGLSL